MKSLFFLVFPFPFYRDQPILFQSKMNQFLKRATRSIKDESNKTTKSNLIDLNQSEDTANQVKLITFFHFPLSNSLFLIHLLLDKRIEMQIGRQMSSFGHFKRRTDCLQKAAR